MNRHTSKSHPFGSLRSFDFATYIRPATEAEFSQCQELRAAGERDVIRVDRFRCYVVGGPVAEQQLQQHAEDARTWAETSSART